MTRTLLVTLLFTLALEGQAVAKGERCGSKSLYDTTLKLYAMGEGVRCADVPRVTRGACKVRENRAWSCFSFRARSPVLAWFKSDEMFADDWSGWIEARRPACSRSKVTAGLWRRGIKTWGRGFPTRLQVLSDDLVRCRQLRGKRYGQVIDLLGKPDELARVNGRRTAEWEVGPERDSLFQIDSEFLSVRFDRQGRFRSAGFEQG